MVVDVEVVVAVDEVVVAVEAVVAVDEVVAAVVVEVVVTAVATVVVAATSTASVCTSMAVFTTTGLDSTGVSASEACVGISFGLASGGTTSSLTLVLGALLLLSVPAAALAMRFLRTASPWAGDEVFVDDVVLLELRFLVFFFADFLSASGTGVGGSGTVSDTGAVSTFWIPQPD